MIGDFNEIVLASKMKGGVFVSSRVRLLQDCFDDSELMDLKMVGNKFTWQWSMYG